MANQTNPSQAVLRVLALLHNVREQGEGWTARCPAHEDSHNSLSIREGTAGRVLLKCHAGCDTKDIVKAIGLEMRDLFHGDGGHQKRPAKPGRSKKVITVEELARDKALPTNFLCALGLKNRPDAVLIPYRMTDGSPAPRQRLRTALRAKDGSRWLPGDGKPTPYGLDRIGNAREARYQILVEGESDCWTLWYHDLPALGIPGAAMYQKLEVSHLEGIDRIYVIREPDPGGDSFSSGIATRLRKIGWEGEAFEVRLTGAADVNDLHKQNPDEFKKAFQEFMDRAEPLSAEQESKGPCDDTSGRKRSQADRLVALVADEEVELFHDQVGETWARLSVNEHLEIWRCRGRDFRRWLANRFWHRERKAPNSEALASALNVIEAKARFEGKEHVLNVRVAVFEGALWYDLVDKHWRAIRINSTGWEIVPSPPVLFRRYAHQRAQVEPVPGGDLRDLLTLTNLTDSGQQLLLLVYLVSSLVPDIPHPIPVLHGPQGAAKTTLFRMMRRLIDPSITETLSIPEKGKELVQQLSHHWTPFYDNITTLSDPISDALCRASTGEGFSKRGLYTDDDDVIYSFRRCVGFNGINIAAHKPDLLDRCILFSLEPIPPEGRKAEKDIWSEFERSRASLFGAILDALSRAMALLPSIKMPALPRMADFARWGYAIAQALGYAPEAFLTAYDDNLRTRNEEVLVSSPVAAMVVALMEDQKTWEGSPKELLIALDGLAHDHHVDTRLRAWPKAPHVLTRRLNEVRPNLAAGGIRVTGDRCGKSRNVSIVQTPGNSVISVTSVTKPASSLFPGDATGGNTREASQVASPASAHIPAEGDSCDACDAFSPPLSHTGPAPSPRPCRGCGGTHFWRSKNGSAVCATCHPPAATNLVVDWIDGATPAGEGTNV